jgi:hypothetical protein
MQDFAGVALRAALPLNVAASPMGRRIVTRTADADGRESIMNPGRGPGNNITAEEIMADTSSIPHSPEHIRTVPTSRAQTPGMEGSELKEYHLAAEFDRLRQKPWSYESEMKIDDLRAEFKQLIEQWRQE